MANLFVQANSTVPAGANPETIAYASNVTGGNLLAVAWRWTGTAITVSSITDTITNAWVIINNTVGDGGTVGSGWAYALNNKSTGANTVTLNLSSAPSGGVALLVGEWSGPNTFRTNAASAVGTSAAPTSNAITPTAGDLVLSFLENTGGSAVTAGSGFVLRGGSSNFIKFEDQLTAVGGSTTATYTITSGNWVTSIASFFTAAGGGAAWVNRERRFVNKR